MAAIMHIHYPQWLVMVYDNLVHQWLRESFVNHWATPNQCKVGPIQWWYLHHPAALQIAPLG